METKNNAKTGNKKKKFTLKKVKKIIINFFKNLGLKIKELFKKFMGLPKHIRLITYIWIVVIILLVLFAILSNANNKLLEKYSYYETEMNNAAIDYVKTNNLIPGEGNKLKLDLNFLMDYDFLYKDTITDSTCRGFSIVYYDENNEDYVAKSYLNCKKYTTKGYSDYK